MQQWRERQASSWATANNNRTTEKHQGSKQRPTARLVCLDGLEELICVENIEELIDDVLSVSILQDSMRLAQTTSFVFMMSSSNDAATLQIGVGLNGMSWMMIRIFIRGWFVDIPQSKNVHPQVKNIHE